MMAAVARACTHYARQALTAVQRNPGLPGLQLCRKGLQKMPVVVAVAPAEAGSAKAVQLLVQCRHGVQSTGNMLRICLPSSVMIHAFGNLTAPWCPPQVPHGTSGYLEELLAAYPHTCTLHLCPHTSTLLNFFCVSVYAFCVFACLCAYCIVPLVSHPVNGASAQNKSIVIPPSAHSNLCGFQGSRCAVSGKHRILHAFNCRSTSSPLLTAAGDHQLLLCSSSRCEVVMLPVLQPLLAGTWSIASAGTFHT